MRKKFATTIAAGVLVSLSILLQPTTSSAAEDVQQSLEENEVGTYAFLTGMNLRVPTPIHGPEAHTILYMDFSGDKNGNNRYVWTLKPRSSASIRSGSTPATSASVLYTYKASRTTTHTVTSSVAGYSSAGATAKIRHTR